MADDIKDDDDKKDEPRPKAKAKPDDHSREDIEARVNAAVDAKLAKSDARAAVKELYEDNFKLRDKLREATAKAAPEGAVVLSDDDAADWAAYRKLGKPRDISKTLNDGRAASERLADIEATEQLRSLGRAAGLNPEVFADRAKVDGLGPERFEVKDERRKDGKAVRRLFVKGEGEKTTPIDEYAESRWSAYLPVLREGSKVEPARAAGTPPRNGFGTPPPAPQEGEPSIRDRMRAEARASGRYAG